MVWMSSLPNCSCHLTMSWWGYVMKRYVCEWERILFSCSVIGMPSAVSWGNVIRSQHGDQIPEREKGGNTLLGARHNIPFIQGWFCFRLWARLFIWGFIFYVLSNLFFFFGEIFCYLNRKTKFLLVKRHFNVADEVSSSVFYISLA